MTSLATVINCDIPHRGGRRFSYF